MSFLSMFVLAFLASTLLVAHAFVPRPLFRRSNTRSLLLVGAAMFVGFVGPFLARDFAREWAPPEWSALLLRAAYFPMGWAAVLTFLSLLAIPLQGALGRRVPYIPHLLAGLSLAVALAGYWQAHHPAVEHETLAAGDMPGAPLRIAILSDVHVGGGVPTDLVSRAVEETNALVPDLVALTGDIWEGDPDVLAPGLIPFQRLRSRYGCFYVVGNHERHRNDAGVRSRRAAEIMGCTLLDDDGVMLQHEGTPFLLAGVSDRGQRALPGKPQNEEKAQLELPADEKLARLRVLLLHRPEHAPQWPDFDVILSGHTHAGQFPPFSFFVAASQPFFSGRYDLGRSQLYVTRGTGYWGPPLRFPWAGEVSLLEIQGRSPADTNAMERVENP